MITIDKPNRAHRAYRLTLLSWAALVAVHASIYLAASFEAGPTDEIYANSVVFQLAVFCLTVLPYWALALLALLIAEFATFGRAVKRKD